MPINIGRFAQRERREESFSPTGGQTIFNLSVAPTDPTDVDFYVNNIKFENGTNYTVSSNQVTWLDTPFSIEAADSVEIVFFV